MLAAAVAGSPPAARLEASLTAHPHAYGFASVVRASCEVSGKLAGAGDAYACSVALPGGAASGVCLAFDRGRIIRCGPTKVDCPRYEPPSRRAGFREVGGIRFPGPFSAYACNGTPFGLHPSWHETGFSNFNAQAGFRRPFPSTGVFFALGLYEGLPSIPQRDTRLPLALSRFQPDRGRWLTLAVWSHGRRYTARAWIGRNASARDRDALERIVASVRPPR
jgi:hypothetical protein